jgi:hypothetical protein
MNFKTIAAAALLAVATTGAFADSLYAKGDITSAGGFDFASSSLSGSFTDTYTFTLTGNNELSDAITNAFTAKTGKISDFTVKLVGPSFSDTQMIGVLGKSQTAYADYADLAAGTYTLTVSGIAQKYSTYGGSLSVSAVSAVPEPASVALLLAGVGCMGFVAKRRKQG